MNILELGLTQVFAEGIVVDQVMERGRQAAEVLCNELLKG